MANSVMFGFVLVMPFLAFLPTSAQSTQLQNVTSDGRLRMTIISVTKPAVWISKDKTEDGEQIVVKPKPPNQLVLVKVRLTVLKPVDGLVIADVSLRDKADKKYHPAIMPISGSKRSRGYTVINEYLFTVPATASFTTFNISTLTFDLAKYLVTPPKAGQ